MLLCSSVVASAEKLRIASGSEREREARSGGWRAGRKEGRQAGLNDGFEPVDTICSFFSDTSLAACRQFPFSGSTQNDYSGGRCSLLYTKDANGDTFR